MIAVTGQRWCAGPLREGSWVGAERLRWPSSATLDQLLADLVDAVQRWSDGWGVEAASLCITPSGGVVPSPGHTSDLQWNGLTVAGQDEVLAWLDWGRSAESPVALVRETLFGDGFGVLAQDVAGDAWAELCTALASVLAARCLALGGAKDVPGESLGSAAAGRQWSGLVAVQLDWSACNMGTWWLLCRPRPALADGRRAPVGNGPAPLASLGEALVRRCIQASVSLVAAELPLRSLVRMRPGDVVSLSHRLDAPVIVRVGPTPVLCDLNAALARVGLAKAVVLVGVGATTVLPPYPKGDQMSASQDRSGQPDPADKPVARWLDLPAAPAPSPHAPPLGIGWDSLLGVRARVEVRLGSFEVSVGELTRAPVGAVFALDRGFDDPVDLLVEGSVVARGQLVAVDDCFAVRLTEVPLPLVGGRDGDDACAQ